MKKQKDIVAPKKNFHIEFKNTSQKIAWMTFAKHDILFLLGPAGVGKSLLATAFAISEILNKRKKKIVLTRPIVEAGESLGYLPMRNLRREDKSLPYATLRRNGYISGHKYTRKG